MKISEIITDKYKLRIPPTVYYDLLTDVVETEEDQEPCVDYISRQAVLEQINCWIGSGEYRYTNATHYLAKRVQDIPSVTPKPKTGHWIWKTEDIYRCSECGEDIHVKEVLNVPQYEFCPNCGAKMEESE